MSTVKSVAGAIAAVILGVTGLGAHTGSDYCDAANNNTSTCNTVREIDTAMPDKIEPAQPTPAAKH